MFKYCSTFDSTPQGNIGPVAEALLDELGAPLALVCPAFPANGRTVYQGHLFVGDRLLSESGMEKHPLTPMTDPDIRRWLARQTQAQGRPSAACRRCGRGREAALRRLAERNGERLIVADAIADADLVRARAALARAHRLVTGGSGIAMGLPANFGIRPARRDRASLPGSTGPAIVLVGQLLGGDAAAGRPLSHDGHPVAAARRRAGAVADGRGAVAALPRLGHRRMPARWSIRTARAAEAVRAAQARYGRERLAAAVRDDVRRARRQGRRRAASGASSWPAARPPARSPRRSAATRSRSGPRSTTGVPALASTTASRGSALALKSGNFGGDEFFAKARSTC